MDWLQFRGPHATGVADGQHPPTTWDVKTGTNVRWKTPIPGLGHSCPVVWGDSPAWTPTLGELVKAEKAGFGGLCGVAVDPAKGTVWVNISDRGFYRSDDQAKTFRRCGDTQPKGRTESPGCLLLDPTGKSRRLMTALVYGAPVSISADGGETWKSFDAKSGHTDWAAADWTDPGSKFVLALKHEAGGLLLASRDGGAKFDEVGKGYGPGWVFDGKAAVVAEAMSKEKPKPNLMRTTDGGRSREPCGEFSPVGTGREPASSYLAAALFQLPFPEPDVKVVPSPGSPADPSRRQPGHLRGRYRFWCDFASILPKGAG